MEKSLVGDAFGIFEDISVAIIAVLGDLWSFVVGLFF